MRSPKRLRTTLYYNATPPDPKEIERRKAEDRRKQTQRLKAAFDLLNQAKTCEGTNFETLLDELRHKMAMHYLSGNKVSVNEAAYLVGFSDPSSFSRAFKRWTGESPGRMRGI